ncbi:hypothetical protein EDB84DRAFT_1266912 [Lactarius hengduanensis]|nr:hypothetical protein EDB84DRAFT_1266912 [Lactarius hengduanensis]
MVNIYLNIDGSPLSLLTIPNTEAERLSIHPLKWIRYVMFTICGAFGDLSPSPAPDGPSVDYDTTSLANDIDLYYNPSGSCIFVDYNCLVERATTTDGTSRRHNFRNEYLSKVVEDRWDLYDPRPPPIDGVNDIQNGVLLKADLHRFLSIGSVALLKTPNYGLDPTDIRRFERGPTDTAHITLHRLKKPDTHVDALFNGTGRSLLPLPHDIVLDYMYGVAAYKRWRSTADIHDVMKAYHAERYAHIPALPRKPPSDDSDDAPEPYDPPIDDLNLVLMFINRTTPEEVAERMEKRVEEEERAAQKRGRNKVTEWMRYTDNGSKTAWQCMDERTDEAVANRTAHSEMTQGGHGRHTAQLARPKWRPYTETLASVMVNIYLNIDGSPLSLLTIPNTEAERLSIHPFKWIRYVMFTICGAFGDLSPSLAPDGPSVYYDSTSLASVIDLYYNPSRSCIFVDYNCLVERATTTDVSSRRHDFRKEVIKRDGGSCYILTVVGDRLALYNPRPPPINGVNDIQNGVLLNKELHSLLSKGEIALLKTPNYGLDPTDIRRFERGPTDTAHITLHQLMKPDTHVDALFNGADRSLLPLPHDIVLDYMYGVAAYKRWKSTADIHAVMKSYYEEHYANIRPLPRKSPSDGGDDAPEPHDPRETDYNPRKGHHPSTSRGDVMGEAIDDLNLVLMFINGTTPEEVAERREKRMEEEERAAQERGRNKVTEWMRYTDVVGS